VELEDTAMTKSATRGSKSVTTKNRRTGDRRPAPPASPGSSAVTAEQLRKARAHIARIFHPQNAEDFECAFGSLGISTETFGALQVWTDCPEDWASVLAFLRRVRRGREAWEVARELGAKIHGGGRDATDGIRSTPGEIDDTKAVIDYLIDAINLARSVHLSVFVQHAGLAAALPHLTRAQNALTTGDFELDETIPTRAPGRKPALVLRLDDGKPATKFRPREVVERLRALLLDQHPPEHGSARQRRKMARPLAQELLRPLSVL